MENSVFMTIKGSTQGLITEGAFTPDSVGNIYQNGHEDEVAIKSFDYGTATPINQTGQITGQRSHQPLSIVKHLDKSSPLLFEASNKGETLTNVELKVYRTSYRGRPEHYYTIALEDAVISSITASSNGSEPVEYVNFSYRKIELRHETSSTSSFDDIRTGMDA